MKKVITKHRNDQLELALSKLFGKMDQELFEFILPLLEWKEILGNQYLFHQGDVGGDLYIMISGRMYAIIKHSDKAEKIVGQISRGETIGEMSLFTDAPRSASVKAVRDSQVIRLSREAYEKIIQKYPAVSRNITKLIVNRLVKHNVDEAPRKKVANITLVPISKDIKLSHFAHLLETQMADNVKVLNLTSGYVNQVLNDDNISSASAKSNLYHHFSNWLEDREYENDFLIFQADFEPTEWTKRCLRQADEIILIGDASQLPELTELEKELLSGDQKLTSATLRLILLQKDNNIINTSKWLQNRKVSSCYHIRNNSEKDIKKLVRFLTNNAVGLVLSGGGAKGLSHVGVFRALHEHGIPIDYVGGTSIGSIIASMIALDKSPTELHEIAKEVFMSNPTSLGDYNLLPFISLLRGNQMDKAIEENLGNMKIEDMPINFFCVSANLSRPQMAVHESGSIGKAVRASISLPGVFPPAILDNDLHIDGGMVNNLPIDVMEKMNVKYTIAVDLDSSKTKEVQLEKMPTGWQYLSSKLFKRKRYRIPNIMSTIMQSSMISSVEKTRQNKSKSDLYIQPNVSKFGLMDWKSFHKIEKIGYQDTLKVLENWKGF